MIRLFLRLGLVLVVCLLGAAIVQRLLARDVKLAAAGGTGSSPPTRPVTVQDVLAANIPTPIRSRVSFPAYSYAQANPGATDQPEIVITGFAESPELAERTRKPRSDPDWLPPVAERLPRNPAVVRGPDGIGVYGGDWRECTTRSQLGTKVGYESFVRFDPSGQLQPGLAYRWEVSPDNRAFTFHLRKGHRWSDGHPFTAQDIVWVCNTVIGSPRWAPPDWMRPTDGANRLYAEDVRDWPGLANAILADTAAISPGARVRATLAPEALVRLREVAAGGPLPPDAAEALIVDLNRMLRADFFGEAAAWSGIDLAHEERELLGKGFSRLDQREVERLHLALERAALFARAVSGDTTIERTRLHVLLFRAAFASWVAPAAKRRVRVEAVPDATGDNSHIVRFTFDKPNAIFLEKTATFMFYTGLFQMPRHFVDPLLVSGQVELAASDILDAPALVRILGQARGQATALGRLAGLLQSPLDAAGDPAQLLADLNRIARGSELYQTGLWPLAGFERELAELRQRDVIGFGFSDWYRLDELLDRADLLRRVADAGLAALSPPERLRLHIALIRTLFPPEVVAVNREAGLNHAAQTGPRKYTNWISRASAAGNYHPEYNPHTPVLSAWRLVSEAKERHLIAIRNPYYYKVDERGNQLPYIDRIVTQIEREQSVRLLKLRSGNVDFQTIDLKFEDFTVLKQNEAIGGYEVRLWASDYCGEVNFWPLQTHRDPQYRRLFTDRRFRQALSLGLNRQEIIDVVYKGMGKPAQYSVPEGSPYYNPRLANAFIEYAPERANALLDAVGITSRDANGMRRFWDGTPLSIDLNTAGEAPVEVVQMACNAWQALGLNVQMKFRQGGATSRMIEMGTADIVTSWEGGNTFGPILASAFAPTHPAESRHWSAWVKHLCGDIRGGEEPPPWLVDINRTWESLITAPDEAVKMAAWRSLTDRAADELPIIGLMTSPGRLVYVRKGFRNVPRLALSGWIAHEPGNCCPEVFFIDPKAGG